MMPFPRRVALDRLAVAAVTQSPLARKSPSAVMAATVVAIDAMAVEMIANVAVEAM